MAQPRGATYSGAPPSDPRRSLTEEGRRALSRVPGSDRESAALGFTLTRAAHAHSTASEALVHRRHDRSWLVFNVLYVLWALQPVSARDVAEGVGMSRQTISNTLRALEVKGMITRTRDAHDARLMTIRLTAAGQASIEKSLAEQFELDSAVFAELTPEERGQLTSLLDRVRRRIQDLDQDPPALGGLGRAGPKAGPGRQRPGRSRTEP
jgi:MarR family transcriptional regulator, transcriptional regulator for hemolysin